MLSKKVYCKIFAYAKAPIHPGEELTLVQTIMEKDVNVSERKTNPKAYFIIGYFFLLAMALCWSVDNSIVLILFGAAVYFLFLGFDANAPRSKSSGWKKTESFNKQTSFKSIADLLKNIFSSVKLDIRHLRKASLNQGFIICSTDRAADYSGRFCHFFLFTIGSIFSSSDSDFESPDYFTRANSIFTR